MSHLSNVYKLLDFQKNSKFKKIKFALHTWQKENHNFGEYFFIFLSYKILAWKTQLCMDKKFS